MAAWRYCLWGTLCASRGLVRTQELVAHEQFLKLLLNLFLYDGRDICGRAIGLILVSGGCWNNNCCCWWLGRESLADRLADIKGINILMQEEIYCWAIEEGATMVLEDICLLSYLGWEAISWGRIVEQVIWVVPIEYPLILGSFSGALILIAINDGTVETHRRSINVSCCGVVVSERGYGAIAIFPFRWHTTIEGKTHSAGWQLPLRSVLEVLVTIVLLERSWKLWKLLLLGRETERGRVPRIRGINLYRIILFHVDERTTAVCEKWVAVEGAGCLVGVHHKMWWFE